MIKRIIFLSLAVSTISLSVSSSFAQESTFFGSNRDEEACINQEGGDSCLTHPAVSKHRAAITAKPAIDMSVCNALQNCDSSGKSKSQTEQ